MGQSCKLCLLSADDLFRDMDDRNTEHGKSQGSDGSCSALSNKHVLTSDLENARVLIDLTKTE